MKLFYRLRYPIILLFAALITISAILIPRLRFFYDLDKFFASDDKEVAFLRRYQTELESDDSYIMIAIDNQKSIYDTLFLGRLYDFTLAARKLNAIASGNSIVTISEYARMPFGFLPVPLIHRSNAAKLKEDSIKINHDPRWNGYFVSKDAKVAVVILKTIGRQPASKAEGLVNSIDSLVAKSSFKDVHIVSRAHAQITFVKKTEEQLRFYTVLAMCVLVVIMILVFRRFWGVVIPVFSSITGLILFMGYLAATGHKLDLMSTLYPVLVLTIGMSDVIHIMNKYIEEQGNGRSRQEAMSITIKEIGLATLITCLSTVIGFLASLTIAIEPIQNFSINAAIGVFIAYLTVILLTCTILTFFDGKQLSSHKLQVKFWDKLVKAIFRSGEKYPRRVGAIWTIAFFIALAGILRITENTYLLSDVPRDDKLRKDYNFMESSLSGARPFEMAILPVKGHNLISLPVLRETEKLENYLNSRHTFGNIVSPVTLFKSINRSMHGLDSGTYVLPESEETLHSYKQLLTSGKINLLNNLINKKEDMGRLSSRIKDEGSENIQRMNASIDTWVSRHIDTGVVKFKITGTALMVDRNNDYLRQNLFQGLALAFILIALVMALLFRSFKMVIISLIPNIFPLVVCGAIMGWMGIELKATTAIIFEIVFGIAVDDTIHFLTQYRLELSRGVSPHLAVKNTFMETGKAIILTSLILFSGFITLVFSDFTATYYIGLLMSLTFISAVLSDLYILPLLLRWAYKDISE